MSLLAEGLSIFFVEKNIYRKSVFVTADLKVTFI